MGENYFAKWPVALYGIVLLMAGFAYYLLVHTLIDLHGKESGLARVVGKDRKGILSVLIYAIGMGLSFVNPWIGFALYVVVTVMWFIPDKRMEKLHTSPEHD